MAANVGLGQKSPEAQVFRLSTLLNKFSNSSNSIPAGDWQQALIDCGLVDSAIPSPIPPVTVTVTDPQPPAPSVAIPNPTGNPVPDAQQVPAPPPKKPRAVIMPSWGKYRKGTTKPTEKPSTPTPPVDKPSVPTISVSSTTDTPSTSHPAPVEHRSVGGKTVEHLKLITQQLKRKSPQEEDDEIEWVEEEDDGDRMVVDEPAPRRTKKSQKKRRIVSEKYRDLRRRTSVTACKIE